MERYWSEKISERYLRDIGKLSLEGIGESLELFPCKSLQKHVCFVVFALVSDEKKVPNFDFFLKKYVNIMFFSQKNKCTLAVCLVVSKQTTKALSSLLSSF